MRKLFKIKSIKTKLTAILLIVCIVPVIASGTLSYKKSYGLLSNKLQLTSQQNIEQINRGIENYFNGFESDINMLSNNASFKEVGSNPAKLEDVNNLLKDIKESNPDIASVYYGLSSNEFYVYPFEQVPDGYMPTARPWYISAINKQGLAYSEPYVANTGKLVVSISKTVRDDNGIIGVVACDIELDKLSSDLSSIKIGNDGYIAITDANGLILAHPEKNTLGASISENFNIWDSVSANGAGFSRMKLDGKDEFVVYDTNASTGWKIIAFLDNQELLSDTNAIKNFTIITVIAIAVIALLVALYVSNSISRHLITMIDLFQRAASGDLSVQSSIKTNDEFENMGIHFNHMMENIGRLIRNVKYSCNTIVESSDKLKANAEDTSKVMNEVCIAIDQVSLGAASQSADIHGGVKSIKTLADEIGKIENLANVMNDISSHATDYSRQGLAVMDMLTDKTAKVNESSMEVGDIVDDVNRSVSEIEAMAHSISQIASKTALLSLNAAIEAARAGDYGKGFSVVADEIRSLSEQAQKSTQQIHNIIDNIKHKSELAVDSMRNAKVIVEEQTESVDKTVEILTHIINSIGSMVGKIKEIENSIYDTNKEKESIINNMTSISSVAEQNLVSTEEVVASAEEVNAVMNEFNSTANCLKSLAQDLEINISKFTLDE